MAFMNQEQKSKLAPAIKAALKKYGMKGTIAVRNHSTLIVNIQQGNLDFEGNGGNINHHSIDRNYSGEKLAFLSELVAAMSNGNHDNSDVMTDYFDVGWYLSIYVGQWDKPYVYLNKEAVA